MSNQGSDKNILGNTSSQGLGAPAPSDGNTLYSTSGGTTLYNMFSQDVTVTHTVEHVLEGAEKPELNMRRTYPVHTSEIATMDAEIGSMDAEISNLEAQANVLDFEALHDRAQAIKSEAYNEQENQQEQEQER